jgi:glycosyltransferase involved in cell wall biosynthesis
MTQTNTGDLKDMCVAPLVSVVINNYNYAAYLRCAVESALSQTYPFVEVLVVDDGSRDGSRIVLDTFRGRILAHFQENRGQAAAMNAGFAASRGDIVIFLDADDFLEANAVDEIVTKFRGGYAKVHVRLRVINEKGDIVGVLPARGRPLATGSNIEEFLQHSRVGCVPTSGNAFDRRALERSRRQSLCRRHLPGIAGRAIQKQTVRNLFALAILYARRAGKFHPAGGAGEIRRVRGACGVADCVKIRRSVATVSGNQSTPRYSPPLALLSQSAAS